MDADLIFGLAMASFGLGSMGAITPPELEGRPWRWSSPITSDPVRYERVTGIEDTMSEALAALMGHLKEVSQ